MRAIIFFIITSLIVCLGCPKPKEVSYLEKMRIKKVKLLKEYIEKNSNLTKEQKFLLGEFYSCYSDVMKNPHTIDMLMPWQTNLIKGSTEKICLTALQQKYGNIKPLLEASFEAKK